MNNEEKTPIEWFQQLKEPYRSEAIERINLSQKDLPCNSLAQALWNGIILDQKSSKGITFRHIYDSIKAGETTYLETELKPQDMISGEWYVVETWYKYLTKFKGIENQFVNEYKGYSYKLERINTNVPLCELGDIKSIRKATREEVLEHFPDEFQDEKKVLKMEQLKHGKYYTLVRVEGGVTYRYTFNFKSFTEEETNPIKYYKMYVHHTKKVFKNGDLSNSKALIYHATQEEISLLSDEKKEVESELKEGEGYFYTNINGSYTMTNDLNYAINSSESNYPIYKATPIGTKQTKSILEPIKTK